MYKTVVFRIVKFYNKMIYMYVKYVPTNTYIIHECTTGAHVLCELYVIIKN